MKAFVLELLACPACLPREEPLSCAPGEQTNDEVWSGQLACPGCGAVYPIVRGVAVLLPGAHGGQETAGGGYERKEVREKYLWAHYADLHGDPEANTAHQTWSELFRPAQGPFLEAGCAVGRLCLEAAGRFPSVVGLDRSFTFIETARDIVSKGRLEYGIVEEGLLRRQVSVQIPLPPCPMEFIVADAMRMPFRSGVFAGVSSLNLVDRVPRPLDHLAEVNRVSRPKGAQFLFADPFSWTEEAAPPDHWLGGKDSGDFRGHGLDNVEALLRGEGGVMAPPYLVERKGALWWRIRDHRNHFESIRSLFLKACR